MDVNLFGDSSNRCPAACRVFCRSSVARLLSFTLTDKSDTDEVVVGGKKSFGSLSTLQMLLVSI